MNYELVEKLYKSGFPGIACSEESPVPGYSYPNLSELIEACGKDFLKLERVESSELDHYTNKYFGGVSWCASSSKDNFSIHDCSDAKTPEEAVANLWLKLSSGVSESTSPTNL